MRPIVRRQGGPDRCRQAGMRALRQCVASPRAVRRVRAPDQAAWAFRRPRGTGVRELPAREYARDVRLLPPPQARGPARCPGASAVRCLRRGRAGQPPLPRLRHPASGRGTSQVRVVRLGAAHRLAGRPPRRGVSSGMGEGAVPGVLRLDRCGWGAGDMARRVPGHAAFFAKLDGQCVGTHEITQVRARTIPTCGGSLSPRPPPKTDRGRSTSRRIGRISPPGPRSRWGLPACTCPPPPPCCGRQA